WIPVFNPLVHLVPLARGLGVAPMLAATLVSALGLAAITGRVALGTLSDHVGRRPALAVSLGLQVAAFLGFAAAGSLSGLYLAAIVFGFSYGAVGALFPPLFPHFFRPPPPPRPL